MWSNSTKVSGAEVFWCSALKSVCGSWEEVAFFCQVDEKGIFVVGYVLIHFPAVVFELHHACSDLQLAASCWLLLYGVKYRNINVSCPNYRRAQSCSCSCAVWFLSKKPEPELYQQCALLCRSSGWSFWWSLVPQESCRFHTICSYWCADSPAGVIQLWCSVTGEQAYRQSLTWWWAMQEGVGIEILLKRAEFPLLRRG